MRFPYRFTISATIACALLLAAPTLRAGAQLPHTITAQGSVLAASGDSIPFTLIFRPSGGAVTGTIDYRYERDFGSMTCLGSISADVDGRFAGGDRGYAVGSAHGVMSFRCDDGDFSQARYDATWNGTFDSDGTAGGIWKSARTYPGGVGETPTDQSSWSLTYSPQVFQAATSAAITPAYIYSAYGMRVTGEPGGETHPPSYWSPHELVLLDEALKLLPSELIPRFSDVALVRAHVSYDGEGQADGSRLGTYFPCDLELSPKCTPPAASVRIYDRAHNSLDFPNDPDGHVQFKATIIHELTHALEAYREPVRIYPNTPRGENGHGSSSVLEDWIADSVTVPESSTMRFWSYANGWTVIDGNWVFLDSPGNELPTRYSSASPGEDMAESVMLYVFDPWRLRYSSPARYEFIRDRIFGGLEYEGGRPMLTTDTIADPRQGTAGDETRR